MAVSTHQVEENNTKRQASVARSLADNLSLSPILEKLKLLAAATRRCPGEEHLSSVKKAES